MNDWIPYFGALIVYFPGLWFAFTSVTAARFPIVTFYFLGLFFLNALGSIYVLLVQYSFGGVLIASREFLLMLVTQALLVYFLAGPYVLSRRSSSTSMLTVKKEDNLFVALILLFAAALVIFFYKTVGSLLVIDLFTGSLNAQTAFELREQKSTGVEGFLVFRFGFLVIPALAAGMLTLISLVKRRLGWLRGPFILVCLMIPLTLADKAGSLRVGLNVFIAYILFQGLSGRSILKSINLRVLLIATAALLPTLFIISAYYGTDHTWADNLRLLVFRVFGAHSEALSGIVPYVQTHGILNGATLPNLHGMLPHGRLIFEDTMHPFLTGLPGKIPVSANAEGFVNFGWPGFVLFSVASILVVIGAQELFRRLSLGLLGSGWMVWYAYLAMMLATNSLFSTFISFTYVIAVFSTLLLYAAIKFVVGHFKLQQIPGTA